MEALLAAGETRYVFRPARHPAFHPGQSATIHPDGADNQVGIIGVLHPEIQEKIGLDKSVICFELQIDAVQMAKLPKFHEISGFPAIRRDLAVVVDAGISAQKILDCARNVAGTLLVNLELFDEYRGEGIDSGRKSLALGLTFQDSSRTLNDKDVEAVVEQVTTALQAGFGAQLRQ